MSEINEFPPSETGPSSSETGIDNGRREALERLAKYTAPAMLAMLLSTTSASVAASAA